MFVFVFSRLMQSLGESGIKAKREKMAFKKMECISQFLAAAERYGIPKTELFQTVDLYEQQNMSQVVQCLAALGRKVIVVYKNICHTSHLRHLCYRLLYHCCRLSSAYSTSLCGKRT